MSAVPSKPGFYGALIRKTAALLVPDRGLVILFLVLSICLALTEGIGVAMIVPIIGVDGAGEAVARIPVVGPMVAPFFGLPANERLLYAAAVLAGVLSLRGVVQYYTQLISAILPLRLQHRLSAQSYGHLLAARYDFVSSGDHGQTITQLRDFPVMVGVCVRSMVDAVVNLMLVAIYFGLMLLVSWQLTLGAIAFMGAIFLLLKAVNEKYMLPAGKALGEGYARFNRLLQETVVGMKLIRLQAAEPHMRRRFDATVGDLQSIQRHMAYVREFQNPLATTLSGLLVCGLLAGGALFMSQDSNGLLAMVAIFIACLYRMLAPATRISNCHGLITVNAAGFDSLDRFQAAAKAAREPQGGRTYAGFSKEIAFEHVDFGYAAKTAPVLTGFSLSIPKGSMVALVGPSGAGKSTVLGLLSRLYEPQSGRLLADGACVNEFDIRSWRQRLSVVSQDTVLFNDTVANNLALGLDGVSRAEIERAAVAASADEFICTLPQGYDEPLGDRGARLSGGQQQRLALARAFLVKPDLLLLDEATSQLDAFTEKAVQNAVREMRGRTTIVVVAHRLSTVQFADTIVVMDKGRIVEQGQHNALISKKGIYWDLLQHQRLDLTPEN